MGYLGRGSTGFEMGIANGVGVTGTGGNPFDLSVGPVNFMRPGTDVQATINGYGERAGNANMVSLLANLALKTKHSVAGTVNLADLSRLSHEVAEIANLAPTIISRMLAARRSPTRGACTARPR